MPRLPVCSLLVMAGMITLYIHSSASQPLSNSKVESDSEEMDQWPAKEKRPFCNAFAGCGRKRSTGNLREGKVPEENKLVRNHFHFSNNEVDKLLDKLFSRLQHFRANSGQIDNMDYN